MIKITEWSKLVLIFGIDNNKVIEIVSSNKTNKMIKNLS